LEVSSEDGVVEWRVADDVTCRLALEFALQDGSPAAYGLDGVPAAAPTQPAVSIPSRIIDCHLRGPIGLDPTLQSLLDSIHDLTSHLNTLQGPRTSKLNPYDYSDIVCTRLHQLLDYAPLDSFRRQTLSALDDMVHLGLLGVMTTLMPEYGSGQARYDLLASQMGGALRAYASMAERNEEVFVWAAIVGCATVLPASDHVWLTPLVKEVCGSLITRSWEEVRSVLCRYAWIGVLYDKAGARYWDAVLREGD
jgi:hypothetical protein